MNRLFEMSALGPDSMRDRTGENSHEPAFNAPQLWKNSRPGTATRRGISLSNGQNLSHRLELGRQSRYWLLKIEEKFP
ncbi:hypothetical protein ASD83_09825 [Devosia sp. Root685]|nr:hypothetical protein ASD83_09825 [Devosia sp. Root685]